MVTAQDLLDGASLRVVLRPDPRVQVDFPDMIESFALRHILIDGERFIGKTSNCHALGSQFEKYDLNAATSYAYSNFLNVMINCSQTSGLFRAVHRHAYQEIRFVVAPNYRPIWEHGREAGVEPVEAAVSEGRLLRIALLDPEGFWNLHPVHLPSCSVGKGIFELFTEQDAVPVLFRFPRALMKIETELIGHIGDMSRKPWLADPKDAYRVSYVREKADFYSCCYAVRSNGEYLRGETYHRRAEALRYRALKVFAEL